jgi:F-type H+-transporting ATPase subunit a
MNTQIFSFFALASAPEAAEPAGEGAGHAHLWIVERIYHLTHLTEEQLPAHVIMLTISAVLCIALLKLLVGKPSVDKPSVGQQVVELIVLQVRDMVNQAIGPYGYKYLSYLLPVAFFILISNLMGLIPLFESPTANFNVTLPLGVITFLYYTFMGLRQQGFEYVKHFAQGLTTGFIAIVGVLVFIVELISNCLRPGTLGLRLMANMYGDEQLSGVFGMLIQFLLPCVSLGLGTFTALVQTFVFTQLTVVYLSETIPHHDHADHDDAHHGEVAHA